MSVLISVLVAVYKAEMTLPAFVQSLVKQGFGKEVEFIFVNDASPDNSELCLKEELERGGLTAQSKVITNAVNCGISKVRQIALDAARGKYVLFADPDDTIDAGFWESIIKVAEETYADLVWEDYWLQDGETWKRVIQREDENAESLLYNILRGKIHGALWNKLLRREFIGKHRITFPEGRISLCEDVCFLCSFLSKNPKVTYLSKCHYRYHVVGTSATRQHTLESFKSLQRVGAVLERLDLTPLQRSAVELWKKGARYSATFSSTVSLKFLSSFFPEVRDLSGMSTNIVHKVLFWFAIRRCRRIMCFCYNAIHKFK